MPYHLEPLVRGWWNEVTGDQIELSVACGKVMHSRGVSSAQTLFAYVFWNVDEVQAMIRAGPFEKRTHPCARRNSIGVEIKNDGYAETQKLLDVLLESGAQAARV